MYYHNKRLRRTFVPRTVFIYTIICWVMCWRPAETLEHFEDVNGYPAPKPEKNNGKEQENEPSDDFHSFYKLPKLTGFVK